MVSLYPLLGWRKYANWYYSLQGALFGEIIPHGLYIQLAFLGKIRKIFGLTRKVGEVSELLPFSELHAMMDCEDCSGMIFVSSRIRSPHTIIMTRIIGSKKIMVANVATGTLIKMKLDGSDILPIPRLNVFKKSMMNLEPAFQLISKTLSLGCKNLLGSVGSGMSHKVLIKKFIESVEKDQKLPVTAEEGREVVKATNMLWNNILR